MRGLDPGLEENLDAYLSLDYADYQVAFVTDRKDDPSFEVAQRASARYPDVPCRVLVAGGAVGRGQKVHNLLHALAELREQDRVLVFGDSDIRPGPSWLRDLVEPLADPQVGASTGFRWHVPVDGGPASVLRSVWNAGIASLMTGGRPPFAWGGAMAIRRETFDAAGIRERWQGALSDDYVVTSAVEDLGLTIRFEPRSLSFTYADCSMRELLDWSFRQLAITRVYRPVLWRVGLLLGRVGRAGCSRPVDGGPNHARPGGLGLRPWTPRAGGAARRGLGGARREGLDAAARPHGSLSRRRSATPPVESHLSSRNAALFLDLPLGISAFGGHPGYLLARYPVPNGHPEPNRDSGLTPRCPKRERAADARP